MILIIVISVDEMENNGLTYEPAIKQTYNKVVVFQMHCIP